MKNQQSKLSISDSRQLFKDLFKDWEILPKEEKSKYKTMWQLDRNRAKERHAVQLDSVNSLLEYNAVSAPQYHKYKSS